MSASRIAWITVLAVAVAGSVAVAVTGLRPRPAGPQRQGVELSTATVERADLVETQTVDGEIGYGPATPLPTVLSGTVTAPPVAGATISRNQRLYAVDARSVILLAGTLPAWRDLAPGVRGRDVRQLEQNLSALGYDGFTVDDRYTSSTARAVRAWQRHHGLLRTGEIELGRVVFLPSAVRVASSEVVAGQAIAGADVVLHHTSTARTVSVDLEVALSGLARPGTTVQVSLPGQTAVPGRIATVSTEIERAEAPESGSAAQPAPDADPTIAVTIAIADQSKLGSITGAPVEVRLAGNRRNDVLTVPVAALLALSEGGHGLELIDGASRRTVAVETGMFASGRVEVSGPGIEVGVVVGMAAS